MQNFEKLGTRSALSGVLQKSELQQAFQHHAGSQKFLDLMAFCMLMLHIHATKIGDGGAFGDFVSALAEQ